MGQLLHDLGIDPGALVVNIVSFALLLWLLKRKMFGPVGLFIEARKRHISQDLDKAQEEREAAEATRQEVQGRKAELMEAARQTAEAAKEQGLAEAEEIKKTARSAARETERAARSATEREALAAASELRNEVTGTAAEMCRQLLQKTLTEERHRALMDQFIADIEKMAAEQALMRTDRSLTRRYVAAVHQLAVGAGEEARVREELARLQEGMAVDARLMGILRHPEIGVEEKRALLLRLAGEPASQIVSGLVDVLLEKERVEVLLGAADMFTELSDEAAGAVRARVEVAWEPDADQKARLEAALSRLIGRPVVAEYSQHPDVVAGARVRVAGRVIDGSLGGQTERLEEHVREAAMSVAGDG